MIERNRNIQKEVYSANQERMRGQKDALAILHQFPTVEDLHQEAALAEKNKQYKEASVFKLLAEAPDFVDNHQQMEDLQYENISFGQQLKKRHQLRDKLFLFNEATKEYLNQHADESIDYVTSLANTSYQYNAHQNNNTPSQDSLKRFTMIARGMRAELAVESILGRFTQDVDFDYDQIDDPETRRRLDAKGIDYSLDVTALGETFTIDVDIKANRDKTLNSAGYAMPGKLWSQCSDKDFINNSSRLNNTALYGKIESMRRALIEQIILQHPGHLEHLSDEQAVPLEDIPIE